MQCPLDGAELVMSERQGIEIDYCPKCRGVWLDRGELDKLIERSSDDVAPAPQQVRQAAPQYAQPAYHGKHYDDDDDKYKRKKHKSLLGELFDF